MQYDINASLKLFKESFEKIKNTNWIESNAKGSGSAGVLLENALGLQQNELEIPDFCGIELKTKKKDSKNTIKFFSKIAWQNTSRCGIMKIPAPSSLRGAINYTTHCRTCQ